MPASLTLPRPTYCQYLSLGLKRDEKEEGLNFERLRISLRYQRFRETVLELLLNVVIVQSDSTNMIRWFLDVFNNLLTKVD